MWRGDVLTEVQGYLGAWAESKLIMPSCFVHNISIELVCTYYFFSFLSATKYSIYLSIACDTHCINLVHGGSPTIFGTEVKPNCQTVHLLTYHDIWTGKEEMHMSQGDAAKRRAGTLPDSCDPPLPPLGTPMVARTILWRACRKTTSNHTHKRAQITHIQQEPNEHWLS